MCGQCSVQDGEVVFSTRIKQSRASLPELSSAELPVSNYESISNIFENPLIII